MDTPKDTPQTSQDVVQLGSHVQVELVYETDAEQLELDIVPDQFADFANGLLGEGTPLAKAILGRQAGDIQAYQLGDIQAVKVLSVSASANLPDAEEFARRQEARRKAVEETQRRDAMIFASSYNGKWGDYDPEGIESWNKED
jgi:Transcription elongation factor, GreA/GreB, C-term